MKTSQQWIDDLGLQPHPEGGYFRETYRSSDTIPTTGLPARFSGPRQACTAIYYLLQQGQFSAFHRICSDEIWHFYSGAPLTIHVLDDDSGTHTQRQLGLDIGNQPQLIVPAGAWFGARIEGAGEFTLVGCTVAPGFDFADFELADRAGLRERFPEHAAIISALTT